MILATKFHDAIMAHNPLLKPTAQVNNWLNTHPTVLKAVLVASHLFRALAMAGLMSLLPFPMLANVAIGLAGSLFYRLVVEDKCAYKFALPSMAGGSALLLAKMGAVAIFPLGAYLGYVLLTVNYDVDHRSCCAG